MALLGPRAGLIFPWMALIIQLASGNSINDCPITCFCDSKNVDSIPGGIGLKINCHPSLSATGTFDIKLPTNTVQLDLAKYGLREIKAETFSGLFHLQKLDLQGNKIQVIEDEAFRNLPKLEILDLSRNQLQKINKGTLAGLASLQRLKLADNSIQTIYKDSFKDLRSLQKVDISENHFVCDCHLKWLIQWMNTNPGKVANNLKTKCQLPIKLADKTIKEVDIQCSEMENDYSYKSVNLSPSNAQVVFEGDSLSFHCQSDRASDLQWLINETPLSADSKSIIITKASGHTVLSISRLDPAFKGQVTCRSQSDSTSRASVDILVLPQNVPLCQPISTETSRGHYKWSSALGGMTLRQWCQRKPNHHQAAEASLQCRSTGEWAPAVNVSECAYTSEVTDTLHKFATMNTSFTMNTLLESAKYFLDYTSNPGMFQNPMDVVYFSQAVENYLPYLQQSNDVGHHMMDMLANILGVDTSLMVDAQKHGMACRRLLDVMENVSAMAVPAFRHDYDTLAVETMFIKPSQGFNGRSCSWYDNRDFAPYSPRRVFHCVQSNQTVLSQDKKRLLASLTVPASLFQEIDFKLLSYGSTTLRLMFAAFDNSSLFPTSAFETSQVIGCKLLGSKSNLNLTDPMIVSISIDPSQKDTKATPVLWNQFANVWESDHCQIMTESSRILKFSCSKMGYYALRYDSKLELSLHEAVSKWHNPISYVGASIAGLLLLLSLTIFAGKMVAVGMAPGLKHALLNLWLSSALLLYLYIMGIYQVNQEASCRIVAFLLHLFMISSLLWILIGVYVIYSKISNSKKKNVEGLLVRGITSDDKRKTSEDDEKPVIKYYFVAYGLPALIVIITAATSIDSYQNEAFCFLTGQGRSLVPFIGALVVPCVLVSTVMIGFGLSILCVLSTSPYKVTEETDQDYQKRLTKLDASSSPKQLLFSLNLQYLILVLIFIMSGCQLALPDYALVFSVFGSLFSIIYGAYTFANFCLLRQDVVGLRKKARHHNTASNNSPENEDITANLVELCPRPLPPTTNSSERTSSLRPNAHPGRPLMFTANNLNLHPGMPENNFMPKTSSPANSHIPQVQDLTVSPLTAATAATEPYSVVPLAFKMQQPEMSLASVNTGLSYTDTSTIRLGAPCDMATFEQPSSASLIGTGTPKKLLNLRPHSSSLPRSLRQQQGHRVMKEPNDDETQSKFSALSVGSSRSGHSRSGRKRHKKPNRRRSRQNSGKSAATKEGKEPIYKNVGDDNYLGDDDQFDTLERHRRTIALPDELPSVIHEVDGDEDEDEVGEEDLFAREEPASLDDLPRPPSDQFDLPKRETSV